MSIPGPPRSNRAKVRTTGFGGQDIVATALSVSDLALARGHLANALMARNTFDKIEAALLASGADVDGSMAQG